MQWCCLFENELLSKTFVCWMSNILILLLSVLMHLCATTVPPLTISPLLVSLDILPLFTCWMHLFVSALDSETEQSNDRCKLSKFLSITLNFLFIITFFKYDSYVFNACICCCCTYLKFICAGSTD